MGVRKQADTVGFEILDFAIDRRAEVPIGVQLAWALRTRIRDGRLNPGQRLPGLRELAQALKVNANTIRAVYQRLEHEGFIESQRGSGTFVADTAGPQRSAAGAIAANAAREALRTGVDPREVAAALYVEPSGATPQDGQSERRQRLREQIAALEQALAEIEVAHPGLVPVARASRRGRGPRLLEADELEQVQADLIRRLATIQIAIDDDARRPDPDDAGSAPAGPRPARESSPSAAPAARPSRARAKTRPATAGA
jgi:DNA-binding transcriptional regulator YhcF (GntR family)